MSADETLSWLRSLKVGDLVDLKPIKTWGWWQIARIEAKEEYRIQAKPLSNQQRFYYRRNEAEWVDLFIILNQDTDKDFKPHPNLRRLNTWTPKHMQIDSCRRVNEWWSKNPYCKICIKSLCKQCCIVPVVTTHNDLVYHCKECEFSRRYKELFVVIKFTYDSIFDGNTDSMEINIIYLITNYASYYQYNCYKQLAGNCDGTIEFENEQNLPNIDIEMEKIRYTIAGFLCLSCERTKYDQKPKNLCKIYHDSMYGDKCIKCSETLCDRCIKLHGYQYCVKCGRSACLGCDIFGKSKFQCGDCRSKFCYKCIESYQEDELLKECEKCNDKLCKDCFPCCCQYQNVDILDMNASDDSSDESDEMVVVD